MNLQMDQGRNTRFLHNTGQYYEETRYFVWSYFRITVKEQTSDLNARSSDLNPRSLSQTRYYGILLL